MHIKRIRARAFKRFHDLTIEIPGTPRLVVMCGPNGLGKSSVIDALRFWHGGHGAEGWFLDESYHHRAGDTSVEARQTYSAVEVEFSEPVEGDARRLLYVRSAYRHEPDFTTSTVERRGDIFASHQVRRMIDGETKVSDNYQRLVSAALDDMFSGAHDGEAVGVLRDKHIGRVREAMLDLFPDLELQGPGDPIGGGTFYFRKGGTPQFHYKNLSGGEKAAFDLILDLVIKIAAYDDTVFCIDEPELHLNTRLQGALLGVLLQLIPPSGQLWVATHSIGMMRAAQKLYDADHNDVAFLDFENRDFDQAASLAPIRPDRDFWARTLKVALDDLAGLVAPDRVVLCEGRPASPANTARAEFDARCYRSIFSTEYPRTDFISVGNAADLQSDRLQVGRAIEAIVSGTRVIRVVDRDMRSPQEIVDLEKSGTRVLSRRHLESYLLDDEVLAVLCAKLAKPELLNDLIATRERTRQQSVERGNAVDDVKSFAGEFYVLARGMLGLVGAGNTTDAFLADTLAPLIAPGMAVYKELKKAVFDEV